MAKLAKPLEYLFDGLRLVEYRNNDGQFESFIKLQQGKSFSRPEPRWVAEASVWSE